MIQLLLGIGVSDWFHHSLMDSIEVRLECLERGVN